MKGLSGAETLLRVLRAMGVERIFASPGSDWAPLWEALAKLHWPDVPEYLSTRHEETAVGMATGYAKATGKLPALVLHTTVGALHATMGVRAALHERIPMVVLAGESIGFAEGTHSVVGPQGARVLSEARNPVIVTEEVGKSTSAVRSLVAVAELLGAPVLDAWQPYYVNFPREHPLYGGVVAEDMGEAVREADLVFLVEAVAPWHPPSALPGPRTRVVVLGEEPLHSNR